MDRLARQREGAGDHRLAGDDRRHGGENDDRQQRPFREHQEEGIGHGFRMLQNKRALPEIVERQRRKDQAEPGPLDRLAAEMAEVGVKRFRARHRQEDRAEHDDADKAGVEQEVDRIPGIEGREDAEVVTDMIDAGRAMTRNQTP